MPLPHTCPSEYCPPPDRNDPAASNIRSAARLPRGFVPARSLALRPGLTTGLPLSRMEGSRLQIKSTHRSTRETNCVVTDNERRDRLPRAGPARTAAAEVTGDTHFPSALETYVRSAACQIGSFRKSDDFIRVLSQRSIDRRGKRSSGGKNREGGSLFSRPATESGILKQNRRNKSGGIKVSLSN
jgi:hypothetical protein